MVFRLRKKDCKEKNWAEQIAKERRKERATRKQKTWNLIFAELY